MNRDLPTFPHGEEHVKINHFTRKGYDITGLIHVGANDGYEIPFYLEMGIEPVLAFEPLRAAYKKLAGRFRGDRRVIAEPHALGSSMDLTQLRVASGDGQSSTLYELTPEYKAEFPDIEFRRSQPIAVIPFESYYYNNSQIDISQYNCAVIDVEGHELEVLKGFGIYLKYLAFLSVELSGEPTYVGGPTANQVVDWLADHDFIQDSPIEPHNDVFFIRKDVYETRT